MTFRAYSIMFGCVDWLEIRENIPNFYAKVWQSCNKSV